MQRLSGRMFPASSDGVARRVWRLWTEAAVGVGLFGAERSRASGEAGRLSRVVAVVVVAVVV